jgi:hypothetical protein
MRYLSGLLLLVCAAVVSAQSEDPEVVRARLELNRIESLVTAGALPRADLEKAQDGVADAQDSALIHQRIYQQDLTEAQSDELVAATERQFERRKKAYDQAEKLVAGGLAPQISLDTYLQNLDFARKQCDLAESRARLTREMSAMAEVEAPMTAPHADLPGTTGVMERFDGNGVFTPTIFRGIERSFEEHFGKPLPVSAMGETAVHRALGFDHRGRVDVAVNPDQPEGVWLREYCTEHRIPFYAFRQAVQGKATGAHIHLGPGSTRLVAAD